LRGDSTLTMEENAAIVREMAEQGGFSMFHASAKTTRGCLSTDDGWIGNLLTACAATGKLEVVLVELFHHEDPALAGLRALDPRHRDRYDGRTDLLPGSLRRPGRRGSPVEQSGESRHSALRAEAGQNVARTSVIEPKILQG